MPGKSPVTMVMIIIATRIGTNSTNSVMTLAKGTIARGKRWDRINCIFVGIELIPDITDV